MTMQQLADKAEKDCQDILDMLNQITPDELRYITRYYIQLKHIGTYCLTDVMHWNMVLSVINIRGLE